jgi:hypothetical protein
MKLPTIEARVVTQFRLPGESRWLYSKRAVYIRAALRIIRSKCPNTAVGRFCYSDDPSDACKWHAHDARYARKVVARLVRMWTRASKEEKSLAHAPAKR